MDARGGGKVSVDLALPGLPGCGGNETSAGSVETMDAFIPPGTLTFPKDPSSSSATEHTLYRLLTLSNSLGALEVDVRRTFAALTALLGNDEDMATMYLSHKAMEGEQRPVEEHTEVELMLEAFATQLEDLLDRALAAWDGYHKRLVARTSGPNVIAEDPALLLYYQNRCVDYAEALASEEDHPAAREIALMGARR